MAFATKFRFNLYSYHIGTYWKIDLQVDGYAGSVLSKEVADESFQITTEGQGGGKFGTSGGSCIKGTSANLSILIQNSTDRDLFLELATVEEQEWKMLIYKGTAPGNEVIYHELFIQPDVYQFPYEDYPYFISLRAVDEIGRLQSIKFYSAGTTRYTTRNTIMYFIFEILDKLGIQRSIREVCNIYSTEMDDGTSDSPLMQATVDPTTYLVNKGRDNEDVMNCHQVLNELLKPFCLIMTLGNDNRWYIRRLTELAASSHTQRIISDATTVDSTSSVTGHILTTNTEKDDTIVTFINSPVTFVDWRWKRMTLTFNLGDADSLVLDGDFAASKWDDINTLTNWSKEFRFPADGRTLVYERVQVSALEDYQAGHFLPSNVGDSSIYTFTPNTGNDYLQVTDALDAQESPFKVGDKVYISHSHGATLPSPLANYIPYWVVDILNPSADGDSDPDIHQIRISNVEGGDPVNMTNSGSGTFYLGFSKEASIKNVAQLNGYQTNLWSDDTVDDKSGIESATVAVIAGAGNTFEIAFWWKILFDNSLTIQANGAEAYYELKLVGASDTYYYSVSAGSWGTTRVVNTITDPRDRYEWYREKVNPADFPVDGDLSLILYTPSSASNTDTSGIQYALVESSFLYKGQLEAEIIQKTAEVGKDYAYDPPEIEVMNGDAPSSVYRGHIGIGSSLTTDWYRKGVTESKELLDLMMQTYMNNYGRTSMKVSGMLMADFDAEQVISDDNLDYEREGATVTPKLFFNGGSYNVENGTWNGEWVEINN